MFFALALDLATVGLQMPEEIPALPAGQAQEMTVQDPAVTNGVPSRIYRLVAPAKPLYYLDPA